METIKKKIFCLDSNALEPLLKIKGSIAVCYGYFDLIHPGHLRYLQHAKTLADHLVIAILDQVPDSGIVGNQFSAADRAENVASLHISDYVVILNDGSLTDLVRTVRSDVLVLGGEFEHERYSEVEEAVNLVESYDGRVVFHAGEARYATTELLHRSLVDIESNNRLRFNKICQEYGLTQKRILDRIKRYPNTKLLVIGDSIVDNYVACDALGMSGEAPVLVVKELEAREYLGGAAIVASHVCSLGSECHYISIAGSDEKAILVRDLLTRQGVITHILTDNSRPTTYKTRYVVNNQKLFRVSRLKDHKMSKEIEEELIRNINRFAQEIDGIMISDFVYGVITDQVLKTVHEVSKQFNIKLYGDLQCSSQVGDVTKFSGFHLITPNEREARIALRDRDSGIERVSKNLIDCASPDNLLMKLGSDGFISYGRSKSDFVKRQHFPALSCNPVDVAGAGDSLFSTMAVSLSSGCSLIEASAIGACAASLAVQELGNIPVSRDKLTDYIKEIIS